jgi:Dolichyl-phosphate-mannose-protein mannosyltransferase
VVQSIIIGSKQKQKACPLSMQGNPRLQWATHEWGHISAVVLLVVALVVQASWALVRDSCTYDEPANVRIGLAALCYGEFSPSVTGHHPPLPFMWGVLPMLVSPDVQLPRSYGELHGVRVLWQKGDGQTLLMRCRSMTVVLSVGLAMLVYSFARDLGGAGAGLFALALYVFCPNVLAHSHLITNDIAASLGLTAAAYALWITYKSPTRLSMCIAGITSGLALGAKLSGVLVLPLLFLLPAIRLRPGTPKHESLSSMYSGRWGYFQEVAILLSLVFVTVWAQYGFDVEFRNLIPIPAPAYWNAWKQLLAHAANGHTSYLGGQVSSQGWWYYYFVALALKTPLGLLGLWIVAVVLLRRLIRHEPIGTLCVVLPFILLLLSATQSGQNIGVRHVLPLYSLSFVWVGQLVSRPFHFFGRSMLLGCLLVAHIVAGVSIAPHYLTYFNALAGGPSKGSRWLADSNLDWGQGLIDLRRWMQSNEVDELALEYFGIVKPADYGIRSHAVTEGETGWIAISVNSLLGLYVQDSTRFDWLQKEIPHSHAGHSILIFSVNQPVPSHPPESSPN